MVVPRVSTLERFHCTFYAHGSLCACVCLHVQGYMYVEDMGLCVRGGGMGVSVSEGKVGRRVEGGRGKVQWSPSDANTWRFESIFCHSVKN